MRSMTTFSDTCVDGFVALEAFSIDTSANAWGWFLEPSGSLDMEWGTGVPKASSLLVDSPGAEAPFEVVSTEEHWRELVEYKPRTLLGRRLWEIRKRILASGIPLLSIEELDREVSERRGDRSEDYK